MAYVRTTRAPFVYGKLFFAPKKSVFRPPPSDPTIALEILREFSTTEFVGKLYVNVGTWIPANRPHLAQFGWYQKYDKMKASPIGLELLRLWIDGSGVWKVTFFRDESDESGPYIALGLRLEG
jgi:hypothetical protein